MSEFFGSVWWLIVTLGVLITFHEFGHFVVARRCGVKVLKFSVGFGKALWSRFDRHGTQFVIAAIPLGGYVKMLDEREVEGAVGPKGLEGAHNRASVGARMAISAAGPAFNLIFAVFAFWLVLVIGKPDYQPIVAAPTGLAATAGFEAGDRILAIGDEKIATWSDAIESLAQHAIDGARTDVAVETANGAKTVRTLPLDRLASRGDADKALGEIGLRHKGPPVPAIAAKVRSGMPAAEGGLKDGDRIVAIDGQAVPGAAARPMAARLQGLRAGQHVRLAVERAGGKVDMDLVAEAAP
jgi:regulator of sigma E protease